MKQRTKMIISILLSAILVISLIITWMSKESAYQKNSDKIAVLGYHHLAAKEDKQSEYLFDPWTQNIETFEKQMKYLYDNGYHTITLDELKEWYEGKRTIDNKTVVITFDDSYYSTYELAKPILKKYGFSATCFVIGYSIPKTETYRPPSKQHIPLSLLKDDETLQFASHFHHLHRKINGQYAIDVYTYDELMKDIASANKHVSTQYMAYPFGKTNQQAIQAVQDSNVSMAFRYHQYHKMTKNDGRYELPRFAIHAYTPMFLFRYYLNQ